MPHSLLLRTATQQSDAQLARTLAWSALGLAVLGCVALSVDLRVAYPFTMQSPGPVWHWCRKGLQHLVKPAEPFANGGVIICVLLAFFAVDVKNRRQLLRYGVVVLSAGAMANIGKLAVARWRPKAFIDTTTDAFRGAVWDSFHSIFPGTSIGYPGQSTPSGHTATAVAFAVVLCRRWPNARWVFGLFVGMSILQRMAYGHHYVSDCFWGASVACMVTAFVYHPRLAGGWFTQFESGRATPHVSRHSGDLASKRAPLQQHT